ncbi:unnamed protein product [Cunninghamella blakesleeana]
MDIPQDTLQLLQVQFNEVIDSRVKELMEKDYNSYPDLKNYDGKEVYHAIGGMYGGFSYHIKKEGDEYILYCTSASRVCGGSGQTHRVTTSSYELIDEGFV